MTSSSTNSKKRGKVAAFTLDNINRTGGLASNFFFFFFFWGGGGGGAPGKGGVPLFSGGLQTQGETIGLYANQII